MRVNTKPIRILFLKKKKLGIGTSVVQKVMMQLFEESPNFKLIVIDDQMKIKNKILGYVYRLIPSIPVIHNLFDYIYLIPQVVKHRQKVDYLYIPHYFKYGLLAVFVSSLFKIPFIVPIVAWNENELRLAGASKLRIFIQLKYERWVLRKAKYVSSSDDLIDYYANVIKDKDKFLRFYLPIDTNKFKPEPKSEVLKDRLEVNGKKVIFTAAPLEGVKGEGIKILLSAFALLKKKCDNVILLIAGDGSERAELENLARELNIKKDVKFLGYSDSMPELLNLSDVFTLIFPFGGGIGFATKEAMACEKPCVVSGTAGTKVLNNEEEVLLVAMDPDDIADKIKLLLEDEDYAGYLGINARRRVETDFSLPSAGERLFKKLKEFERGGGNGIRRRKRTKYTSN